MWLHTDHSREQLESQGHLHLLPDPAPVAEKRERMDLTETMQVKWWTFYKPDYFQKHTGIHFLWVLELHHISAKPWEDPLLCGVWRWFQRSPSKKFQISLLWDSRTSVPTTRLPTTPQAAQARWSKDSFASFKLNSVSSPFSRVVVSK